MSENSVKWRFLTVPGYSLISERVTLRLLKASRILCDRFKIPKYLGN